MAINLKDAKNGDKFQTVTGHTVVYHQDENKLEYIPYKYCMIYEPSGKRYFYSNEGIYYKGKDTNLNLIEGTIEPMIQVNSKPVEIPKEEPTNILPETDEHSPIDDTAVMPKPIVEVEPKFLDSSKNIVAVRIVNSIANLILFGGIIGGVVGFSGCVYYLLTDSLYDAICFLIPPLGICLSCLLTWAFIKLIVNISFRLTSIDTNLYAKKVSLESDKESKTHENSTSLAQVEKYVESSNKFVAEKVINVITTIILVIGIVAGFVGVFRFLFSNAGWEDFVSCLICLLSCLLYWALMRLVINISYRLTKIDNKIKNDI